MINSNANTFEKLIPSLNNITPTIAVKAVPNPDQTAYALESGRDLRANPRSVKEAK